VSSLLLLLGVPVVAAWHLAPQKARILPMLALSRSPGGAEVRQIFRTC
jgi:L-asparaginase/Glu-tRNA(Gln) amidotransferase subunit D